MAKVLLTGGTGYIGSHTDTVLKKAGYDTVLVDNFSNSDPAVLKALAEINSAEPVFYESDLLDLAAVDNIFSQERPEAVIHFAGYKAVGESVREPLKYYENNILSMINVLKMMRKYDSKVLIFSSSATVYGKGESEAYDESMPLNPYNPYGRTKAVCENIIKDFAAAEPGFKAVNLRYFNPAGAHESGLLGENPKNEATNLMPYINDVYMGKRPYLTVFGDDYDTPDGTGVRDYIHILDLAEGHEAALRYAFDHDGCHDFNLGSGHGYSVLEMLKTYEKVNNCEIPYKIGDRRPGDLAEYYAVADLAEQELGWKTHRGLEEICRDCARYCDYLMNS